MATKRTKKRHSGHGDHPETAEHMLDRVLGAFDRWLTSREPDEQRRLEVTGIVHTACELKSSYLGEPNPAEWTPAIAVEVVGAVIPRKVVGVDEHYARALVPAMQTFVEFLVLTGRWKPHNNAEATRIALSALEPELPERFIDPNRLSIAGRFAQLAVDEGVDLTEPAALDDFMQRFNDMPEEWRKRITDTPGLPSFGGLDFDDEFDDDEFEDDEFDDDEFGDAGIVEILSSATATGIAAIGFVAEDSVRIRVPAAPAELAALLATPLLTRITALTEWVRPGRKLTSTMAMRRADTVEWARRFGILSSTNPIPNSMWDWPELAAPWSVAAACGLIESSTPKARPGPNANIFDNGDLPAQIRCAREAVDFLIDGLIEASAEMTELDMAVIGLLLALLASLCRPEGADLSAFRSLASPDQGEPADFSETISRILFMVVLNIIDMLTEWGFVSVDDGISSVPPALRPAIVQAIYAPGALFSITLEPGAVPLNDE